MSSMYSMCSNLSLKSRSLRAFLSWTPTQKQLASQPTTSSPSTMAMIRQGICKIKGVQLFGRTIWTQWPCVPAWLQCLSCARKVCPWADQLLSQVNFASYLKSAGIVTFSSASMSVAEASSEFTSPRATTSLFFWKITSEQALQIVSYCRVPILQPIIDTAILRFSPAIWSVGFVSCASRCSRKSPRSSSRAAWLMLPPCEALEMPRPIDSAIPFMVEGGYGVVFLLLQYSGNRLGNQVLPQAQSTSSPPSPNPAPLSIFSTPANKSLFPSRFTMSAMLSCMFLSAVGFCPAPDQLYPNPAGPSQRQRVRSIEYVSSRCYKMRTAELRLQTWLVPKGKSAAIEMSSGWVLAASFAKPEGFARGKYITRPACTFPQLFSSRYGPRVSLPLSPATRRMVLFLSPCCMSCWFSWRQQWKEQGLSAHISLPVER